MGINGVGSEPSLSKIIPIRNFFIKVFFFCLKKIQYSKKKCFMRCSLLRLFSVNLFFCFNKFPFD